MQHTLMFEYALAQQNVSQPSKLPFVDLAFSFTNSLDPKDWIKAQPKVFRALIDTGAAGCVYNGNKIDLAHMTPHAVHGSMILPDGTRQGILAYNVAFVLLGGTSIYSQLFQRQTFSASATYDLILGMDFIRRGNLLINRGGLSGHFDLP